MLRPSHQVSREASPRGAAPYPVGAAPFSGPRPLSHATSQAPSTASVQGAR